MASKSLKTPGYAFPTIPTKYDGTDKRFINAIKKLFDTLFSFKQTTEKEIKKPDKIWDQLYPVGIVVWTTTQSPRIWKCGGGTFEGIGSITIDGTTLYASKRTA